VTTISTPPGCVQAREAQWPQQCFQVQADLILSCTNAVSYDLSCRVINRRPQPSRLVLALHKAPHLIHLRCFHLVDDALHWLSMNTLENAFMSLLSA